MPLFDFRCKKCGNEFEKLAKRVEDVFCPKCGGEVSRLYTAPPQHARFTLQRNRSIFVGRREEKPVPPGLKRVT